ncbi:uncharacterized protein LOC110462967 isoform X2 [Mizuhopecten yessoensis]|nr:uncharacterized protein LOC110462967 isoform X2 [Mizuhopecten yessoensis]
MMTSYGNCTDDVLWTLETIGGCASGDTGGLGVVFGVVCIPLWTFSQLALYLIYCQPDGKASKTGTSHVTCIVVFHWVADVLSLFGCIMTHQLPLQTYYALTSASVHFLAIVPAMLSSRRTRRSDKDMGETTFNCKCLRHCCMTQSSCTAAMSILSAVSLVTVTMLQTPWYKSAVKRHDTPSNGGNIHSQPLRLYVLTGYCLGALSAGLTWLTKFREVIQFYRPYSYTYIRVFLHFVAILSEGFYVTGVLYYNQSRVFILHSLPWTLARMGVAGIHIGILLQGSIHYCSTKDIETDGGYPAIIHSTTSDSDGSEEDHVMFEFPPMTFDGSANKDDISQTDEEGDLGNSYAVFPSTNTAMTYSTDGKRQMFEYTYCDSPADTSSEQDLEWDFECPVVHRDDRPLTSSLKYARMTMGSLKSISSLESDSGYEKVVDWFKRS